MKWFKRITAGLSVFWIVHLFWISAGRLGEPRDLLFESPTVNTAILLNQGVNIYSKSVYDGPPFNLTIYTPAYFSLTAAMPGFESAPFQTGRAISIFFAVGLFLQLIIPRRGKSGVSTGLIATGWLSLFMPYVVNISFFKMDMMALALSSASIAVLIRRGITPVTAVLAGALAGAGILTKQSAISAPIAAMLYLLWKERRLAVLYFGAFLISTLPVFWIINRLSEGGFWWCIFEAPHHPIRFDVFLENWLEMDSPAFYVLLAFSAFCCRELFRPEMRGREDTRGSSRLAGLYYIVSWVWLVESVGKVGAATNYFLEPLYAAVWVILMWLDGLEEEPKGKVAAIAWGLILISLSWPMRTAQFSDPLIPKDSKSVETYEAARREAIAAAGMEKPKILNLASTQASLSSGFDLYLNDPFLYATLWNTRDLSNRAMLTALDERFFDLVALPRGDRPATIRDPTPLGEIYAKIYQTCEFRSEGVFAYYVPRPGALRGGDGSRNSSVVRRNPGAVPNSEIRAIVEAAPVR